MKNSLMLLDERNHADPRIEIEPQTFALAQRNAFPIVAQRTAGKNGMSLAVGMAGALVLGGLTFWSMSGQRPGPPPRQVTGTIAVQEPRPIAVSVPSQSLTRLPASAAIPVQRVGVSPLPPEQFGPGALIMPTAVPGQPVSPTLIIDNGAPVVSRSGGVAGGLSGDEAFAVRVGGSGPEVASATRMRSPGYTVSQGTLIPAVLETAINSDLPGYVRAVVSSDIPSFDGSRVLVPRSSRLIGQYKSGVAGGQTRAYVLWTRLIRPDGVSVALSSPAVDVSGQTGLTGSVDSHFMKRFGSALLLSVVGTASTVASGGASLVLSGGESAATVAAQRDGLIPPTIKVRQGQPIRVFTAKDLDFSVLSGPRR
jgi:type IV secretion system protein VirB10